MSEKQINITEKMQKISETVSEYKDAISAASRTWMLKSKTGTSLWGRLKNNTTLMSL